MISVELNNEQKVKITANPVTSAGNPAPLDGAILPEVISGDATVTTDPAEPNAFTIVSGGVGPSVVRVSADADLGAGVVTIEDSVNVNVVGALASSFGLSAGTPENKA